MAPLTVLWAANSYWDSPFQVGANNLARALVSKGARVGFVSDPVSPFHMLSSFRRSDLFDRCRTWLRGGGEDLNGRLRYYSPMSLVAPAPYPLLRSQFVMRRWRYFTVPNVVRWARRKGFGRVDVLIVDSVSQGFWPDAISYTHFVARVTDRLASFRRGTPAALKMEGDLIRRADVVVYTSIALRTHVEDAGARQGIYIPNGVDLGHFGEGNRMVPPEYESIPSPRVVYVGALDEWFDEELVAACARTYAHAAFVLIGPPRRPFPTLRSLPNIFFLGPRGRPSLPQYLWNADAGLIPFRVNHPVIEAVHPLKLYEYLACGLPVVATSWPELDAIPLDFARCRGASAFITALGRALVEGRRYQDLTPFSWARRAEELLRACGS